MRRTKWQFSLFIFIIISTLFILIVNAASTDDEENEKHRLKSTTTTVTTHHRNKHHTKHHKKDKKHSTKKDHARPTTVINNCALAHKDNKSKTATNSNTKLSKTQTVYVCRKSSTKKHHLSTKKTRSSKHGHHKKKTTTKKHHSSKKTHSTKKNKSISTTKNKKKSIVTKKKITKSKSISTKKKVSSTKTTTTTTSTTTTPAHKFSVTTATPIIAPLAIPTQVDNDNSNIDTSDTSDNSNNNNNYNDEDSPTLPTTPTTNPSSAASVSIPSNATPADNNNQVNAQSVDNTPNKDSDAQPQSKVIGVSIGAVVGCIAAAGLAGMFIYRRRENNKSSSDIEDQDLNQTSEVNTRWRTQSFMAVVAGAVAKLPKRSNSSASTNGRSSFNVLGSIRRAASNASRSLSVRSTSSSVQSYGVAVSGPIPAIARIDGDQAQYFAEPSSPTHGNGNHQHHTHAY